MKNTYKKTLKKIFESNQLKIDQNKNTFTLADTYYNKKEFFNVVEVFLSDKLSQGNKVKQFEKKFSNLIGTKYAVATNSGSSANLIALSSLIKKYKIKKGSEVIIPASTFATVAMPIIQLGLIPVYVDININTLNINIEQITKAISKKTKIIMPVHTLGMPCEMNEIINLAKKKKIHVFEDCCEAHGASIKNIKIGSQSNISAFSFYLAHNINTIEGGMILTNDRDLYYEALSLREFGRIKNYRGKYYSSGNLKNYDKNYVFKSLGYNMRMTEIQGALGIAQVPKLKKINKLRNKNALKLKKIIKKYEKFICTTKTPDNYYNSYYTFPIIIKKNANISRKKLCSFLNSKKIQTRPMMAGCLPDQPAFKNQPGRIVGDLRYSRYVRDNCFFVGVHPKITINQFEKFKKALDIFFK